MVPPPAMAKSNNGTEGRATIFRPPTIASAVAKSARFTSRRVNVPTSFMSFVGIFGCGHNFFVFDATEFLREEGFVDFVDFDVAALNPDLVLDAKF